MKFGKKNLPIGISLISPEVTCSSCKRSLLLRRDRPSRVTLYTTSYGTVTGWHYHKYCSNRGCKTVQFFGYFRKGKDEDGIEYNQTWMKLLYFLSSQETGFETAMFKQFDVELMIGQYHTSKKPIYTIYQMITIRQKCSVLGV